MAYHSIEKSLALPAPRRPFGAGVRKTITTLMPQVNPNDSRLPYVMYAKDSIRAQSAWNDRGLIDDLVSPVNPPAPRFDKEELRRFFESRRSVRNFDRIRQPPRDEITRAVELARHTPSVCNRQASRVHFYSESADILKILSLQNGNAGFTDTIPLVAIVTVRRSLFVGIGERNQRWIDGGLFAMSLVWALHGLGFSTCMLNWSENNRSSDLLRRVSGISGEEDIIMMIAIGHGQENHRVARSERRSVKDVATWH